MLQKPSFTSNFENTFTTLIFMGYFIQGWSFVMFSDFGFIEIMGV